MDQESQNSRAQSSQKSKREKKHHVHRKRPQCLCGVEWGTGVLIITIFKGMGLFLQFLYIAYRFQYDIKIEYFHETKFSATWGYLIYTLILPTSVFIMLIVALTKRTSIFARFMANFLYIVETFLVLGWPVIFLRAVVIGIRNQDDSAYVLLAMVVVYMAFLYPIRLLCAYTVRGYYRDLRFYSKHHGHSAQKDEKRGLRKNDQYMNDKSSVASNEERKLSDIDLGSVRSKPVSSKSKGGRRSERSGSREARDRHGSRAGSRETRERGQGRRSSQEEQQSINRRGSGGRGSRESSGERIQLPPIVGRHAAHGGTTQATS